MDTYTHKNTPTPLYKEDKIVLWRWQWKMADSRANTGTMIDHGNTQSQQKVKLDDKCVRTNVHFYVWVGGFAYICYCVCVYVCVGHGSVPNYSPAQTHYPITRYIQIVCKSSWDSSHLTSECVSSDRLWSDFTFLLTFDLIYGEGANAVKQNQIHIFSQLHRSKREKEFEYYIKPHRKKKQVNRYDNVT